MVGNIINGYQNGLKLIKKNSKTTRKNSTVTKYNKKPKTNQTKSQNQTLVKKQKRKGSYFISMPWKDEENENEDEKSKIMCINQKNFNDTIEKRDVNNAVVKTTELSMIRSIIKKPSIAQGYEKLKKASKTLKQNQTIAKVEHIIPNTQYDVVDSVHELENRIYNNYTKLRYEKSQVHIIDEKVLQLTKLYFRMGNSRAVIIHKRKLVDTIKELTRIKQDIINGKRQNVYIDKLKRFKEAQQWLSYLSKRKHKLLLQKNHNDINREICGNAACNNISNVSTIVNDNDLLNDNNDLVTHNIYSMDDRHLHDLSDYRTLQTLVTSSDDIQQSWMSERIHEIVKEYMHQIEEIEPGYDVFNEDLCEYCGETLKLVNNNSTLICPFCSLQHPYLDTTSASMAYGDEMELTQFTYHKISHFNDWLSRIEIQKNIDENIYRRISQGLCDKGIDKSYQITLEKVKSVMKRLKLTDCYAHIIQITCKLKGLPPLYLSPIQKQMFRVMFLAIQAPFIKHKPKTRTNFLGYSYVIRRFCELLGYFNLASYFPLLKGDDKLELQDQIWQGICQEMDWQYESSTDFCSSNIITSKKKDLASIDIKHMKKKEKRKSTNIINNKKQQKRRLKQTHHVMNHENKKKRKFNTKFSNIVAR